ncbi:MAG: hypothetical protein HY815_16505 [Candidatus Riflebacteria bacterium]|nr:hypothetical protein [Candidatus Riflebacteria bacterium]
MQGHQGIEVALGREKEERIRLEVALGRKKKEEGIRIEVALGRKKKEEGIRIEVSLGGATRTRRGAGSCLVTIVRGRLVR